LATWDVFHGGRLEVERSLTTEAVRAALARGDLRDDDLIRPSGTAVAWQRLGDLPDLLAAPAPDPADPGPAPGQPGELRMALVDEEDEDEDEDRPPGAASPEAGDPQEEEDEEAAAFTLARGPAGRVEELDLAAMVDVAFQMVLFFLVTATTVLYKTLEVPRPGPDRPPASALQAPGRTLDDLRRDYILVEIDPAGAIRVDRLPVAAAALIERLRRVRQDTARTGMLLVADFATPHRHAVLAYDAANEIGLRIAIAKPAAPGPPPPVP
jgi:biopolymer transport protein ExbD